MPPFDHSLLDAMAAFAPFSDLVPKAYSQTEILRRFIQDSGNIAMTLNRNFQNMIPGFIPSNLGKKKFQNLTMNSTLNVWYFFLQPARLIHL